MTDKTLKDVTLEDLHNSLFEIYKTTKDDSVKINALCNLIFYKKDCELKKHSDKTFENMLKVMKDIY